VSTRVTAAAAFVVEDQVQMTTAARVMQVSRQAVYQRLAPTPEPEPASVLRLVAPPLPDDWQVMDLGPEHCDVETAIHVLARRHPAAGYRKITARTRRKGYLLNRKKTARLLKAWEQRPCSAMSRRSE
jgi:hypothetical protein